MGTSLSSLPGVESVRLLFVVSQIGFSPPLLILSFLLSHFSFGSRVAPALRRLCAPPLHISRWPKDSYGWQDDPSHNRSLS